MTAWMDDRLEEIKRRGLYRTRRRPDSALTARIQIGSRALINFASNDYLGLAPDGRLARAAARAAIKYGCGAGASPLITGWSPPLRRLERTLASWQATEASVVFPTGFAACMGTIAGLAEEGDAIFSDALNHASLIDGCRISRACVHVYRHADADHLNDLLKAHGHKARRRFIVSDSVFSMDGDIAPIADLLDLARRHDCLLLVDDAHATGVFGEGGCGATEPFRDEVRLIKIGTLSKALGTQGGFVCGSRSLARLLVNRARPYIFSTALAPPAAAAAHCAVEVAVREPQRRHRLLSLAELLRNLLRALDFGDTGSRSQIVPIIIGDAAKAVRLSRDLDRRGFLVPAIRPPSVPAGTARLRISLTAAHSEDDVRHLAEALQEFRKLLPGKSHAHG